MAAGEFADPVTKEINQSWICTFVQSQSIVKKIINQQFASQLSKIITYIICDQTYTHFFNLLHDKLLALKNALGVNKF